MKAFLPLLLAASLSACNPALLAGITGTAPAPLTQTTIDDRALETAWRSFDVALDAINILTDRGVIVPGSPNARAIAQAIRKVNRSLAAAERFAAAGSSSDYSAALAEALAGINEMRTALGAQS